jgi:hypothetical protein
MGGRVGMEGMVPRLAGDTKRAGWRVWGWRGGIPVLGRQTLGVLSLRPVSVSTLRDPKGLPPTRDTPVGAHQVGACAWDSSWEKHDLDHTRLGKSSVYCGILYYM